MYSNILNVKYSEIRKQFKKFDTVDIEKRVLTLTNLPYLDTVSEDSDVIVYYNVMGNTTPIMLVERIPYTKGLEREARRRLREFSEKNSEYVAKVRLGEKRSKWFDIIVVRGTVYESLGEG